MCVPVRPSALAPAADAGGPRPLFSHPLAARGTGGAEPSARTTIVIADDEELVRQSLVAFLGGRGFSIVGETADGHEAVALACSHRPDVVLIEVDLPGLSAGRAAGEILRRVPGIGILLLTRALRTPAIRELLRRGARGLVLKTQPAEDLVRAVRQVARGGTFLSPQWSSGTSEDGRGPALLQRVALSPRELEVLRLAAEGHSTKQIAARLGIRLKTADNYRSQLMSKLGIHHVAGLVRYAVRHGVIAP